MPIDYPQTVDGGMVDLLIPVGIMIVFIGIIILIIGIVLGALKQRQAKTEGGFIFWIGPIPILGATNKTIAYLLIALSIIFFILILLSRKIFL
ncbi:MAG: DUF131 domain-containing protein [Candidatus Aenigmarchaeota archaeon]|nr:DUF131 domain-containing protein [Candidatus Aenigmarchaeota archaeon]